MEDGSTLEKQVDFINAYLVSGQNVIVEKASTPINNLASMDFGSKPVDGGNFFLTLDEKRALLSEDIRAEKYIRKYLNSEEFINGKSRYCIWIDDQNANLAKEIRPIASRMNLVKAMRLASAKQQTKISAQTAHKFGEIRHRSSKTTLVVPRVSSENRPFLPVGLVSGDMVMGDRNFAIYDAPLWNLALIASRLHWVWIRTVCVRMRTDFSYSNTLGWNTFPVPLLTEQNKADLTTCAENILLAREAHFPATIADLYDPENMPENLRHAHDRNDEVLERIYIGRRFKNDTERLEKLFELYTKMTAVGMPKPVKKATRPKMA